MKTIKHNFRNVTKFYYVMAMTILMLVSCSKKQETESLQKEISTEETTEVKPADPPSNFKHETALVNGVNIHYVIGGKGEPLVLVHGFGQNWYMWNRLLPELSKHFTVIAPDLRGVGESGKPESGYDKKTMATDVHELLRNWDIIKLILQDMILD